MSNFTVLQNQFNSEFGHSSGGQFNLAVRAAPTLSRQSLRIFPEPQSERGGYVLANQGIFSNPRYDNNRFGGQLGGPIFKNKLFFFANYEYNPVGLAAVPGAPVLAPTAAGYTTLNGIPGVSASNIQRCNNSLWLRAPARTAPARRAAQSPSAAPVQVGILPIVAPNYTNYRALTTSMDYNLSDKDQIRGRYIYNKLATIDTGATAAGVLHPIRTAFPPGQPQRISHLLALDYQRVAGGIQSHGQQLSRSQFDVPRLGCIPERHN